MKKLSFIFLGLYLAMASAYAGDGSSGCGAGWYIFKKNSLISSSLRATTNAIFLNATFGMTFGTSNCSKHSIVKNDMKAIHFTEYTFAQLKREMAKADGDYFLAMADIMGCGQHTQEFGQVVRSNYGAIFNANTKTPVDMVKNLERKIKANQSLSKNCQII
jgi:hypothetical protein